MKAANAKQNLSSPLDDYKTISLLGKGAFSKIYLVQYKSGQLFAMKVIKKLTIESKKMKKNVLSERNILIALNHSPFVVNFYHSFQTDTHLYFVIEYCPGGELFTLIRKYKKFSENIAKFYIAQVVLALDHMHKQGVIYRDLKPENVLITALGYIKLTDFGLSSQQPLSLQEKQCGTMEYFAPELLSQEPVTFSSDWWCVGCLLYEMLQGRSPFQSATREDTLLRIASAEVAFDFPLTPLAESVVRAFLVKDPRQRLGAKNGYFEISKHPWFGGVSWELILQQKIVAPWVPQMGSDNGLSNFSLDYAKDTLPAIKDYNEYERLSGFSWQDLPSPSNPGPIKHVQNGFAPEPARNFK